MGKYCILRRLLLQLVGLGVDTGRNHPILIDLLLAFGKVPGIRAAFWAYPEALLASIRIEEVAYFSLVDKFVVDPAVARTVIAFGGRSHNSALKRRGEHHLRLSVVAFEFDGLDALGSEILKIVTVSSHFVAIRIAAACDQNGRRRCEY